jgi:hypothetical protein
MSKKLDALSYIPDNTLLISATYRQMVELDDDNIFWKGYFYPDDRISRHIQPGDQQLIVHLINDYSKNDDPNVEQVGPRRILVRNGDVHALKHDTNVLFIEPRRDVQAFNDFSSTVVISGESDGNRAKTSPILSATLKGRFNAAQLCHLQQCARSKPGSWRG